MKVPLSWLKEYVDVKVSPQKIADALTLAGLEVEGITELEHQEVVFEISLTPNLGYCMNILGIAREVAAALHLPIRRKKFSFREGKEKTADLVSVSIKDTKKCLRYSCRLVKGVRVGPSPDWLKNRLEACNVRSVNNVVDIGNYLMLEFGQPLHMFDYDKLSEPKIIIRSAHHDGEITTLDQKLRVIPEDVLLICDPKKAIAFAGVIGGEDSAISEATQNVLIESACFTPESVRKTSRLLNLRTDGSQRHERGIDPEETVPVLDRAAALLAEIAHGSICAGIVEQVTLPWTPRLINLNIARANVLLGTYLSMSEIITLLARLEIETVEEDTDKIKVRVPSYRNDLSKEIDLVEEIARMYGYNNLPKHLPKHTSSTIPHSSLYLFEEELREKLFAQGLQECMTCDLISPQLAELTVEKAINKEAQIHVLYPASVDQSVLRSTLLPGLLQVVKFNLDRQTSDCSLFEVGHIYFKDKENYLEQSVAGIILSGNNRPYYFDPKPKEVDFFDLKGHVENLLLALGIKTRFLPSHLQNFHPGRQARIYVNDISLGVLGEVHPQHLEQLGIKQRVFYAEINLQDLFPLKKQTTLVSEISTFPSSERDWTISLRDTAPIGSIFEQVYATSSPLLEEILLLDLYKSDKIGKDRKNVTFRFRYRDRNKTVEYEDVEKEHRKLTSFLEEKLKDIIAS